MSVETYDVVVVGGGIAGLTAATYVAKKGYRTALIEKNSNCGGLVNSFIHNGFTFDSGLRALEDAGIIFPMLKELDIQLESVHSAVSMGIEDRILHITGMESVTEYESMLIEFYPESKRAIKKLIKVIKKVMKSMDALYGVENPLFKDFSKESPAFFLSLMVWFPKFLCTLARVRSMSKPVESYLQTFIEDPSLQDIVAQHFFKATPSFFALSYFSLYFDYFYPKGGTGKLPELMEEKFRSFGGVVLTEREIIKLCPKERKMLDNHGNTYAYTEAIWCADLKRLYEITDSQGLSQKQIAKIKAQRERVNQGRGSDSTFSLYVEVDLAPEIFQQIANGHFFYTPSKKGLGSTHREQLQEILKHRDRAKILDWITDFTALNTYEISIPALKDPSLAPPGKTGLIISMLAEYDLFKQIKEDGWYNEFIHALENRIIETLTDSIFPMLTNTILHKFSFSPLSIERRVGSREGSCIGWDFSGPIPAVQKMLQAKKAVITPIPHLHQAGQWVYSPGGCPMSILTGRLAADRVSVKK